MAAIEIPGTNTPVSVKAAATGAIIQNLGPTTVLIGPNADPIADINLAPGGIITIDGGATMAALEWFAESFGAGAHLRVVLG